MTAEVFIKICTMPNSVQGLPQAVRKGCIEGVCFTFGFALFVPLETVQWLKKKLVWKSLNKKKIKRLTA